MPAQIYGKDIKRYQITEYHLKTIQATTGDFLVSDGSGNLSWSKQIGDGTNYSEFESDGTYTMVGDATVWKDINLGSAQLAKPASSQPDTDEFKDLNGDDAGIETYAFAVGEKVSGSFELQHDYKEGSDLVFHIHWQGIAAPSGTDNVKWQLIYTVGDDVALPATTIIVGEGAIDTQYAFHRTDLATIDGSGYGIGDQFLFQLSRIASTGDAYAGDALIATVGLHYEIDTLGSRQITTK